MLSKLISNLLTFDGFLATLETMAHHGFYLREDLYLRAIREARRLSAEGPKPGCA
jgi:hypothetical protein